MSDAPHLSKAGRGAQLAIGGAAFAWHRPAGVLLDQEDQPVFHPARTQCAQMVQLEAHDLDG